MRSDIPAAIEALLPFPLFSSAADTTSSADIISTAESAGQFTTLVTALRAAGLMDMLKGAAPFTASNGTVHVIDTVLSPN